MPNRTDRTHVEDVKDSNKVLLPSRNFVFVTLRMDESGNRIPFTLLDDLPLDLGHGAAIGISVSSSISLSAQAGFAHVVRSPIASRTDWLSS